MLSTEILPSQRQQFEARSDSNSSFFAPVHSFSNFLDRPNHHRRQKYTSRHNASSIARENSLLEQANLEAAKNHRARGQAEQASRSLAREYLERFLETSEWQDHVDRIGIIDEAVPTMEELEAYGTLDEADGTRACRRMFKAVVVWEQVGHSLWERLRNDAHKDNKVDKAINNDAEMGANLPGGQQPADAPRRQSHHRATASRELQGLSIIMEQPSEPQRMRRPSLTSLASSFSRGRKSSMSNTISGDRHGTQHTTSTTSSRPPPVTRRSSSVPVSRRSRRSLQTDCECTDDFNHDCQRRATDPGPRLQSEWSSNQSREHGSGEATLKAAATIPRKLSQNCANAVRRTFEALHDHRGKPGHHEKRRASVGC